MDDGEGRLEVVGRLHTDPIDHLWFELDGTLGRLLMGAVVEELKHELYFIYYAILLFFEEVVPFY